MKSILHSVPVAHSAHLDKALHCIPCPILDNTKKIIEPNKLSGCLQMAAVYSWDNRIKFLVRYMYDLDNNGYLNKNDFDCLAVKFTVLEGRGEWNEKRFEFNFYQQISVILRFQ